jgi:hypothetical protein
MFMELGYRQGIAYSLESFAGLNASEGSRDRAARLWAAAERLREEVGSPLLPSEQEEYDHAVTAARQAMSEEAFSAAWAGGRTMTPEQAIKDALDNAG